jgi:hypothetical protein
MADRFPCPNSACKYQFDRGQLPAAAMVTCPLCRIKFPYRDGKILQQTPVAAEEQATSPEVDFGAPIIRTVAPPKSGGLTSVVVVLVFLLFVGGGAFGVWTAMNKKVESRKTQFVESVNLNFQFPPVGWEQDERIKDRMKLGLAVYHRTEPEGSFGVHVEDFKTREAVLGELKERMVRTVKGYFAGVEIEDLPEGQKWMDRPAVGLRFIGRQEEKQIEGRVWVTGYQGVGYGFLAWAPIEGFATFNQEIPALQKLCSTGRARANWQPSKARSRIFDVPGTSLALEDPDAVWNKVEATPDPADKDKPFQMVLSLSAKRNGRGGELPLIATASVYQLKADSQPGRAGKELLDLLLKDEEEALKAGNEGKDVPPTILEELPASTSNTPIPADATNLKRFLTKNPEQKNLRFIIAVNAVKSGDKLYVVEARCNQKDAAVLEPFCVHLAASLK